MEAGDPTNGLVETQTYSLLQMAAHIRSMTGKQQLGRLCRPLVLLRLGINIRAADFKRRDKTKKTPPGGSLKREPPSIRPSPRRPVSFGFFGRR